MSNLFIQPVGPSDDVEERRNFSAEELNFCMMSEDIDSTSDELSIDYRKTTMNGKPVLWLPLSGEFGKDFARLKDAGIRDTVIRGTPQGYLSYERVSPGDGNHFYTFSWCFCNDLKPLCEEKTCGSLECTQTARSTVRTERDKREWLHSQEVINKVESVFSELKRNLLHEFSTYEKILS
eukprot:GHVP01067933.1.p1 GENE.GHVP01067933.1~~GHVP01067933.1.p1  ORF type:complete len:179 (+),score=15.36 GHVP01067933.1:245-781(+)